MSDVTDVTKEEIQATIDKIYKEFPYLKDRVLTSDCKCCEFLDVQEEYGYDASKAWEALDTYKWLLNE
jgi:hypothetical protein